MARKTNDVRPNSPFLDTEPDKDRELIARDYRVCSPTPMAVSEDHSFHWNVEGPMFNTLHRCL